MLTEHNVKQMSNIYEQICLNICQRICEKIIATACKTLIYTYVERILKIYHQPCETCATQMQNMRQ